MNIPRKAYWVVVVVMAFMAASAGIAGAGSSGRDRAGAVKLVADDPASFADFGRSVAVDGDLAAVGIGDDGDDGAVYLYKRDGLNYVQEAKLECPDDPEGAEFGRSVALRGDMLIVGARFADVDGVPETGAVYVFKRSAGTWQWAQKIDPPTPDSGSNFGRALAVQGDRLIVTARKYESDAENDGTAYAYRFRDGLWTYQTEIIPKSEPAAGAYFGQSVALQGGLLAIGARDDTPNQTGALYLFRQASDGWTQIAKLTPPDGEQNDQYGFTVAMAGDTLAVGARRANPGGLEDAGAAYIYSVNGDIVELVTELTAGDAGAGDEFGQSIATTGDVIAVGARRAAVIENDRQGAVYLFRRSAGRWVPIDKVTASDGAERDEFGYSLAASGNRMITGAHFADVDTFRDAGAAYVIPLKP